MKVGLGFFSLFLSISNINVCSLCLYKNEDAPNEAACLYAPLEHNLFLAENYASYYFYHLNENFGYNQYGTCSYIAVEMLLSFYDSYWNDNVMPEQYDIVSEIDIEQGLLNAIQSPGSRNELNSHYSFDDSLRNTNYTQYIETFKGLSNHLNLLSIGLENQIIPNSFGGYGTFLSDMADIIAIYFNEISNISSTDFEVVHMSNIYHYNSNDYLRNKIIELVCNGIPVIIDGEVSGANRAHSFLAYDYDEQNDEIYVHTGWHNNTSHVKMSDLPYDFIQEILYLDPQICHSHSNNYYFEEIDGDITFICPCSLLIPTNIWSINGTFIDERPIFQWNTFLSENFLNDLNAYYKLSILNSYHEVIKSFINIKTNSFILSWSDYRLAIESGPCFYMYVELFSPNDSTFDDYYGIVYCHVENYKYRTQIKPNEWGFEQRYYFENEGIRTSLLMKNNISINTSRLRCGYIENSFVVLSPRRAGAGRSYFEMTFDTPIYSFVYSLCMWSNHEYLDGQAFMQVKDENGNWSNNINLQIDNLPTKEEGIQRSFYMVPPDFHFSFPNTEIIYHPIYGIRFETTATATGDRNKGRLCIDDIVLDDSIPDPLKIPSVLNGDGDYIFNYGKTHP